MSLKYFQGPQEIDHNLEPWCWLNDDSQTHVFISFLYEKYPERKDLYPCLEVKPGQLLFLNHRYYHIYTRDDSPAKGKQMTRNEAVENFSPRSYTTGAGVVSKNEAKK